MNVLKKIDDSLEKVLLAVIFALMVLAIVWQQPVLDGGSCSLPLHLAGLAWHG